MLNCRITCLKACLGYILVNFSALTCVVSPRKNLINTTINPPPPSVVYRNLPVHTPCLSHCGPHTSVAGSWAELDPRWPWLDECYRFWESSSAQLSSVSSWLWGLLMAYPIKSLHQASIEASKLRWQQVQLDPGRADRSFKKVRSSWAWPQLLATLDSEWLKRRKFRHFPGRY